MAGYGAAEGSAFVACAAAVDCVGDEFEVGVGGDVGFPVKRGETLGDFLSTGTTVRDEEDGVFAGGVEVWWEAFHNVEGIAGVWEREFEIGDIREGQS